MYLTDLTMIEDGNSDRYKGTDLISIEKWRLETNILLDIKKFQSSVYSIEKVPAIFDYLRDINHLDEKDLYAFSLRREPRIKSRS